MDRELEIRENVNGICKEMKLSIYHLSGVSQIKQQLFKQQVKGKERELSAQVFPLALQLFQNSLLLVFIPHKPLIL